MRTNYADDDFFYDEEDVYDDPYDVVMYDIDAGIDNDVYALIELLKDENKSWYAKRRLNSILASGTLQSLVAAIIIDSLGRRWNPLLHPRDRFGKFINTGGFFRWFLNGVWERGQVVRIDSDGSIYARSKGNDRIPDGTIVKFNHKDAAKFISTASDKADLTPEVVDLDAEIPDFPEASATQRRIYNALQFGDMPSDDLVLYRSGDDTDLTGTDFGEQVLELQDKGLVELFRDDDGNNRAQRPDVDQKAVIPAGDIDDVPDDETPDLEDSPNLTKAQRDLYDQMVEMDRGEGDGIGTDELSGVSDEDLEALVETGALDRDGDTFHLHNPEESGDEIGDVDTDADAPDTDTDAPDVVDDIDQAAKGRFPNNLEQQEAFADRASELAGLMEADPDADYGRDERRARSAAEAWWEEYNAPTPGGESDEVDVPEADVPESEQAPSIKRRSEYRSEAQDLMGQWFEDDYLETPEGEKYLQAVTDLLYVADLEEAGENDRADLNRRMAENKLRDIGVDDEDIAGWGPAIEAFRNDEALPDVPEAEEDLPEEPTVDVPEDMPEAPDVPTATREEVIDYLGLSYPETDDDYASYLDERVDRIVDDYNGPFRDDVNAGRTDDMSLEEFANEYNILDEADFRSDVPDRFVGYNDPAEVPPDGAPALREDLPSDVNETELGEETLARLRDINIDDLSRWVDWNNRVRSRRDDDATLEDELNDERLIAEEMGLDIDGKGGIVTWNSFLKDVEPPRDVAEDLYKKHNGDANMAMMDYVVNKEDYDANGVNAPDASPDAPENTADTWNEYGKRLEEEGPASNFGERLDQEQRIAQELGLNLFDSDSPDSWNVLAVSDFEDARRRFIESDGDIGSANAEADRPDDVDTPDVVPSDVPDAKPASENPAHQRIVNQEPFDINNFDYITEDGAGVKDADGLPVQLGGWYRARAGGGGDLPEIVGFYDQELFPGWLLGRNPDGKFKAVHVHGEGGEGGLGGMRRVPDGDLRAEQGVWAAQRRANAGELLDELDQFKAGNRMHRDAGEQPAAVGMMVERARERKGVKWQAGEPAIVQRFGMNKNGDVIAYVARPGARDQSELIEVRVGLLKPHERAATPTPTPTPTPSPDVPGFDPLNMPEREWQIPLDNEIIEKVRGAGDVDLIDFANAHIRPGEVYDQVQGLIDQGRLEVVPNPNGGRPAFRVPDDAPGDVDAPDVPDVGLPRGANNEFEGVVLNDIDAAGDGGLGRGDLVDIDDPDAGEKLIAIRELEGRGVLEQVEDPDSGRPVYRRPQRQTTSYGSNNPSRGTDAGGEPMSRAEAVSALRAGADPMTIQTEDLFDAMRSSGRFRTDFLTDGGIGESMWLVDTQVDGPISVNGDRGRRYFVKRPAEGRPRESWKAELFAAGISQSAGTSDSNSPRELGVLYHPQTTSAGKERIIAEHAAYGFPEGTEFTTLDPDWSRDSAGFPKNSAFTDDDIANATEDRVKLLLYDFVTNNSLDRHGNNQMFAKLPDGTVRVVVIDNGFADGVNWALDSTQNSIRDFIAVEEEGNGWLKGFLNDIANRNNGLTRNGLRDIVESFHSQYLNLDVDAILEAMIRQHGLDQSEIADLRAWLTASKSRIDSLGNNTDEVLEALADRLGL